MTQYRYSHLTRSTWSSCKHQLRGMKRLGVAVRGPALDAPQPHKATERLVREPRARPLAREAPPKMGELCIDEARRQPDVDGRAPRSPSYFGISYSRMR